MILAAITAATIVGAGTFGAAAAEPIEGVWKRPSTGTMVRYSGNGGKYCGTVLDGDHKGKSIGCMSGTDGNYKGTVIALDEGKTYSGKATVKGSGMSLKGCVAGGLICKGETWQRQ
ncbi:MAG: DUF2147 domain-containing protein [Rhizobiaceae bacterium]